MASTSILDLPLEIAVNILSRLPIIAIFRCKSVCKIWQTSLSDPKLFTPQSDHYVSVILYNMYTCNVAQLKPNAAAAAAAAATMIRNRELILPQSRDELVGSANGLVCLLNYENSMDLKLRVFNPMTRESYQLPPLPEIVKEEEEFLFGFSSQTGEYKVLRIFRAEYYATEAQVCTISGSGDESWRDVIDQFVPLPLYDGCGAFPVTFNGALQWITDDEDEEVEYDEYDYEEKERVIRLVSFAIAEERIRQIPLPDGIDVHSNGIHDVHSNRIGLGVLRGCLCIFQQAKTVDCRFRLNIWSMVEHGSSESWIEETIWGPPPEFPWSYHPFNNLNTYHPFFQLSGNEMVALDRNGRGTLVSFNRKGDTTTITKLLNELSDGDDSGMVRGHIIPFVPSFLPLDVIVKGKLMIGG